jgi:hypothetical protein
MKKRFFGGTMAVALVLVFTGCDKLTDPPPEPDTYSISGTITGSDTGASGLNGASVQLKKGGVAQGSAVSTAANGTYTIIGVAVGNYTIDVSLGGYTAGTITAFAVSANVTGKDLTLTKAIYTVNGNPGNDLDQMKAAIAAAGGGTSSDPIVVTITIADASLLSGTNSGGADPLHKLFDAIPAGKYVSFDLSGCTFTTIASLSGTSAAARTNKAYLASITLPDTLTAINNYAFDSCSGLISVTIPSSVTSIGYSAFSGCTGLTSLTIPSSVTSIGPSFSGCTGLTTVTIPGSVTTIGGSAFYGCTGLTSVTILSGVTTIGDHAFRDCTDLATVTIPNSVTTIENNAFYGCTDLTSVTIPNSVTFIGAGAFRGCSGLTSVTIPNSVTTIEDFAFYNCTDLTSVNVLRDTTPLTTLGGTSAFSGNASLVIYVPASQLTAYQSAANWITYVSRIQAAP